jgi:xanthine dehydrogenase molybdenum-binding subunit
VLTTYHIMTAPEMPEITTHYVETDDPAGPYGAKGIGEAPAICVAPAVANAIANATGKRLCSLPFTPEKVLAALKE